MNIEKIVNLSEGKLITKIPTQNIDIEFAMASDLMSDVLTLDTDKTMLITGLTNIQTIRTAEMSDVQCVLLARNKKCTKEMIELAEKSNIVIIESPFAMYRISGVLYKQGIKAIY